MDPRPATGRDPGQRLASDRLERLRRNSEDGPPSRPLHWGSQRLAGHGPGALPFVSATRQSPAETPCSHRICLRGDVLADRYSRLRSRRTAGNHETDVSKACPATLASSDRPASESRRHAAMVAPHTISAAAAGRWRVARTRRPSTPPRRLTRAPSGVLEVAPTLCQQTAPGTNSVAHPANQAFMQRSVSSHPAFIRPSNPPRASNIHRRTAMFPAHAWNSVTVCPAGSWMMSTPGNGVRREPSVCSSDVWLRTVRWCRSLWSSQSR